MDQTASVWLVIALAVIAANLPFLNQRFLALAPISVSRKPLWLRLLEMILLYGVVGAISWWLEVRTGRATNQGWEFFAITGTLFVTLAFPGFVYCYLLKHRH